MRPRLPYGAFISGRLRATSKLSLNVGLRWEAFQRASERYNRENAGWAFGLPNPIQAQAQANYAAIEPASIQALLLASQFQVPGGLLFTSPANRREGKLT